MTDKQEMKVRRNAYKYYDEVIYEQRDWNKRDIALASFQAGADYVLKNKHEFKEEQSNAKPNIVQFLKDNGVYEMFFTHLLNEREGERLNEYFEFAFFDTNAISSAFVWGETPEGHTFWSEISNKWLKQF
jgi:hypothetical protein